MEELMKAIVLADGILAVQNVKKPQAAEPGHIVVKMIVSGINSGDKFFLTRPSLPGAVNSLYAVRGVSGVGEVLEIGDNVPPEYLGRRVTIYRQLRYSESVIGTWSEYAHVHYLDCAIIPENAAPEAYAGSMVNIITPYAFFKQVQEEGHKGIISTAGNSATGIAMIGFCLEYDFPLISIVRNEEAKLELEALGATNILVQNDENFSQQLRETAQALNATAIFDGIGGEILNKIILDLPNGSTIYSYGYMGDSTPLTVHMSALAMKNITIKFFSNFLSKTVKNEESLAQAVNEINRLIHLPHFKTKAGKTFIMNEIKEAIAYNPGKGLKPIIRF